jgi:hypothetical protein
VVSSNEDAIHFLYNKNGRSSGEAYVEFDTAESYHKALLKNKQYMGTRYIEGRAYRAFITVTIVHISTFHAVHLQSDFKCRPIMTRHILIAFNGMELSQAMILIAMDLQRTTKTGTSRLCVFVACHSHVPKTISNISSEVLLFSCSLALN